MKNKQFDAVKMTRDIRDKLSQQFSAMTYEEQKAYLKKSLEQPP